VTRQRRRFRLSKFIGTSERNDITAIFHRLHPVPIYIKSRHWQLFKDSQKTDKKLLSLLKRYGLVKSLEEDEKELIKVRTNYEKTLERARVLYLVLTHKCNLKCKYCFVSQSFKNSKDTLMNYQIARKGIDLWSKHIKDKFDKNSKYFIIFYGGEPLLNITTLTKSLAYIKDLQKRKSLPRSNLEIILITNGILLDDKIIRLINKYRISVTISLDGPQIINDRCRVTKKGENSFKLIEKAITYLNENKIKPAISVTITPFNLNKLDKIPEFLYKYHIEEFGLGPLIGRSLFLLDSELSLSRYIKRLGKTMVDCFKKAQKLGIREDRVGRKVDCFLKKEFYPLDCKAYGGQIVIQPDGDIAICHASSRYDIGDVNNCKDFRLDKIDLIRKYKRRLPLYNSRCLRCKALGICGGGCFYSAEELDGTVYKIDRINCAYTKKIFEFLLWDLRKIRLIK